MIPFGRSLGKVVEKQNSFNPWLAILLTAPIPVILSVLFFFKWYEQKTDLSRVTSYFVERQNTVLAYDAMRVSQKITNLLAQSERDVRTLALIPKRAQSYREFYLANLSRLSHSEPGKSAARPERNPLYLEVVALDQSGNETIRVVGGKVARKRLLSECLLKDLCDQALRRQILKSAVGEVRFGELMRLYRTRTEKENHDGATYSIALRTVDGARILSIDYRHLREILFIPTFPYEPRRELLQSYVDGNYTYYVDSKFDFLAHPKHWHVNGVDPELGQWMKPVKTDAALGTHPVNVAAYQGDQLKDYFNRLLNVSFAHRAADLFRAPNLTGKIRVHAVAPILLSLGQYKETGVFGHVITGCYVDYFEEPKEKFLPYY